MTLPLHGCSATCNASGWLHKSSLFGLQCVCYREGELPQMRKSTNPRTMMQEAGSR